jgi:GPI mannosyltransferase 3
MIRSAKIFIEEIRNLQKVKYVYILSIVTLIITAFFSAGYYHFDEHFQILEFAGLKLKMTSAGNLPWEYVYKMRPAIQPAIVFVVFNMFHLIGVDNPFTVTLFLRLLSASLGFAAMYLFYMTYIKTINNDLLKTWYTLLSFFLWFIIFNNVRFSSESWSGSLFLIAFSLLNIKQLSNRSHFLTGMLLGLSFLFRYQTGFLIAGLILWYLFIKKNIIKPVLISFGILLIIGTGILIDRWFYGTWTLTTWNYFNQNILQNRVSDFGIHPWWYYIERTFIQGIPPFSIVYISSFLIVFIYLRKDLLTWTLLPFLLIHFIIGHKEIRFMFPIIGFIPIVIIKSLEIIQTKWNATFLDKKYVQGFAKAFWIVNMIFMTLIAFSPADGQISLYKKLFSDYKTSSTLYYIDKNPFNRVLDINFYKRPDLEIVKISSLKDLDLNNGRKTLFVTKDQNAANDLFAQKRLVYSTYPKWIRILNFNNWMSRTNCWYVYEINKNP